MVGRPDWRIFFLFVSLVSSVCGAEAQATSLTDKGKGDESKPPEPPTLRLDYSKPLRSLVITGDMTIGGPMNCGSDGTTLFPAYNVRSLASSALQFSVYGVRYKGDFIDSIQYDPALATSLRRISPGGAIGVSDSRVVLSVNAVTADEDASDKASNKSSQLHPFLLFFDRKGNFLYSSALDLDFPVGALGIFESGNIMVAGSPAHGERHRNWVVVDDHGHFLRTLEPGVEGDENVKAGDPKSFADEARALTGTPQMFRYRGHLLLLEMNSNFDIKEVNEGGVVRAIKLQLPKGENLGQFIPSDERTLVVILGQVDTLGSAENGLRPGHFKPDKIAEFDPETGNLLRYINQGSKHHPFSIACEHDGLFTALSEDPKDGSLLVETATAGQ